MSEPKYHANGEHGRRCIVFEHKLSDYKGLQRDDNCP